MYKNPLNCSLGELENVCTQRVGEPYTTVFEHYAIAAEIVAQINKVTGRQHNNVYEYILSLIEDEGLRDKVSKLLDHESDTAE